MTQFPLAPEHAARLLILAASRAGRSVLGGKEALVLTRVLHLPGQHEQKAHGHGSAPGDRPVPPPDRVSVVKGSQFDFTSLGARRFQYDPARDQFIFGPDSTDMLGRTHAEDHDFAKRHFKDVGMSDEHVRGWVQTNSQGEQEIEIYDATGAYLSGGTLYGRHSIYTRQEGDVERNQAALFNAVYQTLQRFVEAGASRDIRVSQATLTNYDMKPLGELFPTLFERRRAAGDYDESKHPRDERGRWTDEGGYAGPSDDDAASASSKSPTGYALADAVEIDKRRLGGGMNPTKRVTMENADGTTFEAVYKPEGDTSGVAWNYEDAGAIERTLAAYKVDQALGLGLVPETAIMNLSEGRGSVQRFGEGRVAATVFREQDWDRVPNREWYRMAVLDVVTGNVDRHSGNFLIDVDKPGFAHVSLIDHDSTFSPRGIDENFRWLGRIPTETKESERTRLAGALRHTDWKTVIGGLVRGSGYEMFVARANRVADLIERGEFSQYIKDHTYFSHPQKKLPAKAQRSLPLPRAAAAARIVELVDAQSEEVLATIVLQDGTVVITTAFPRLRDLLSSVPDPSDLSIILTPDDGEAYLDAVRRYYNGAGMVVRERGEARVAGGQGSGNFGHAGRPGQVGGSSSEGYSATDFAAPYSDKGITQTRRPISLYHSSPSATPPHFDAFFGGEEFISTFSPTEFGEHRYSMVLPKGTKILDLNQDTPAGRLLKAEIARQAWPTDTTFPAELRQGKGSDDDFYEAWTDKRNITNALADYPDMVVRYQDEYLIPKSILQRVKIKTLAFNPDQPRDEKGQWTDDGGGILAAVQQADGGFTYNPVTHESPTKGFALSLHKDRERVLDAKTVSLTDIARFARENQDLLKETGNFLGGWHNPADDKVYLDISTVVSSAQEAERLGREADQLAYFDLEKGQSVAISSHLTAAEALAVFDGTSRWRAKFGRSYRARAALDGSDADGRGDQRSDDDPQLTLLGGQGSGNFGHAGRPGEVGGSAPTDGLGPAAQKMVATHGTTPLLRQAAMLLPDGTLVKGKTMYHEEMAARANTSLDLLGDEGVMRLSLDSVETVQVPSDKQADLLADEWNREYEEGVATLHYFQVSGDFYDHRNYGLLMVNGRITGDTLRNFAKRALANPRTAPPLNEYSQRRAAGDFEGHPFRGNQWTPSAKDDVRVGYSWESQVTQYPEQGPPGVGYFKGEIDKEHHVDTLLYRDESGKVRGILNRYPVDFVVSPRTGEILSNDLKTRATQLGKGKGPGMLGGGMPILVEKAGNVNVFVDPEARRQGIATTLWKKAEQRWNINPRQQSYTTEGRKFYTSLVKRHLETRFAHLPGQHDQLTHGRGGSNPQNVQHVMTAITNGKAVLATPETAAQVVAQMAGLPGHYNLQRMWVEGDANRNLFGRHATMTPRKDMPQLPETKDDQLAFFKYLHENGVEMAVEDADPRELMASQRELDSKKVGQIYKSVLAEGGLRKGTGPLFVSQERDVIDGHHRWAAMATYALTHPGVKIPIARLNVDIERALELCNKFQGVLHEGFSAGFRAHANAFVALAAERSRFEPIVIEPPPPDAPPPPDDEHPWNWVNGQWIYIPTDTADGVPTELDLDEPPPPTRQTRALEFDESKHPRDEKGQWTETGAGVGQVEVRGPGASRVRDDLAKLPPGVLRDSDVKEVRTARTQAELDAKMEEYMLRYYNYSYASKEHEQVGPKGPPKALIDRSRGVMFAMPDRVRTHFGLTLSKRAEDTQFKEAAKRLAKVPAQAMNELISNALTSEAALSVLSFTNPLTAVLERDVVHHMLRRWGWA